MRACLDLLRPEQPPSALFALTNQCTVGAVRALRSLGLSGRVALVGIDDFETADLIDPPVTVISHGVEETGRTAARLLPAKLIPRGPGEIPGTAGHR